jgi:hypothetical protein
MQKTSPADGVPSARGEQVDRGSAAAGGETQARLRRARGARTARRPGLGATTRRPPTRGGGGDRGAPSGAPPRRAHPIGAVSRGGVVHLCSRGRCQARAWAARGTRSLLIVGAPQRAPSSTWSSRPGGPLGSSAGATTRARTAGVPRWAGVVPSRRPHAAPGGAVHGPRHGHDQGPELRLGRHRSRGRRPAHPRSVCQRGGRVGVPPGRRAWTRRSACVGRRRARTRARPWCASAPPLSRGRRPVKAEGAPTAAGRAQLRFLLIS